jgi:hypothetical protein
VQSVSGNVAEAGWLVGRTSDFRAGGLGFNFQQRIFQMWILFHVWAHCFELDQKLKMVLSTKERCNSTEQKKIA